MKPSSVLLIPAVWTVLLLGCTLAEGTPEHATVLFTSIKGGNADIFRC